MLLGKSFELGYNRILQDVYPRRGTLLARTGLYAPIRK